ncbi:MAG: sigma-70 family RNA polymerase sigma factor [Sedimentisphaerales bacterium]|nr:sigma-70 family RNA polymerase sigma factor [Sedimentisphaerales bacterium]
MAENEYILLKRFSTNGDAEAFAEIIKQHAPMVYGVCLRILANREIAADVVQDTFFQLVRDAADITDSIPNWLHKVATHRAIDIVRSDSQRKQREMKYAANPGNIDSEDNKAAWREISILIDEELENLDDSTKEVLILRFFEGQKMVSIAEKCGISQQTVSRRIDSGIELLRHKLKSRGAIVSAAILTAMLTENIVQAAPASIVKELGKMALAGRNAPIKPKITTRILAANSKIIVITIYAIVIGWAVIHYNKTKADDNISVQDLINLYAKAVNSWDKSVTMNINYVHFWSHISIDETDIREWTYNMQFKRDSNKCEWSGSCQTEGQYGDNKYSQSRIFRDIACDDFFFMYEKRNYMDEPTIRMWNDKSFIEEEQRLYLAQEYGGFLEGREAAIGSAEKIAEVMIDSNNLSLVGREKINDVPCFIVQSKTKYGTFTVWIAPKKGYNAMKYTFSKSGNDIFRDDILVSDRELTEFILVVDSIEIQKVDSVYVPISGQSLCKYNAGDEWKVEERWKVKRSDIVLNPHFKALVDFKIDLPEGTEIELEEKEGKFYWSNGKIVSEDEYSK